jgi:GntR family transcriptional regulator
VAANSGSLGPAAEVVRHTLLERVRTGQLAPGQRLGAERDLARGLGVSRSTLRQALAALEASGQIRRTPGRGGGTFISHGKIERDLSRVVGVPALLRAQGITAGTQVVGTATVPADEATRAALQLEPGEYVVDVVRIRLADGSPISLEHARFPAERFPGLLEQPLGGSLYELLHAVYGVEPGEAVERIEVVSSGADEARILEVAEGAALMSITRTTVDQDGEPLEYSHDLFRGDRTLITVRTPGRAGTAGSARSRGKVVELRAQAGP